jgi:hypothetical protein
MQSTRRPRMTGPGVAAPNSMRPARRLQGNKLPPPPARILPVAGGTVAHMRAWWWWWWWLCLLGAVAAASCCSLRPASPRFASVVLPALACSVCACTRRPWLGCLHPFACMPYARLATSLPRCATLQFAPLECQQAGGGRGESSRSTSRVCVLQGN